jgi:predicted membrane channel-forming protein YqfA (hemolysin III family)
MQRKPFNPATCSCCTETRIDQPQTLFADWSAKYLQFQKVFHNSISMKAGCSLQIKEIDSQFRESTVQLHKVLPTPPTTWPYYVFLLSAIVCFFASAIMHTFWVRSLNTCNVTHNIDLSGISVMIFGSSYSLLYYGFQCNPTALNFYLVTQFATLLAILFVINGNLIATHSMGKLKVLLFASQIVISMLATIHWRILE